LKSFANNWCIRSLLGAKKPQGVGVTPQFGVTTTAKQLSVKRVKWTCETTPHWWKDHRDTIAAMGLTGLAHKFPVSPNRKQKADCCGFIREQKNLFFKVQRLLDPVYRLADKKKTAAFYAKNAEQIRMARALKRKQDQKEYRQYRRRYYHKKEKHDPAIRIAKVLRQHVRRMTQTGAVQSASTLNLIGIDRCGFRSWVELYWSSGMTWENYGQWHLDHTIPISAFDLSDEESFKMAAHYTNLRPMWAFDNLSKGGVRKCR